MIRRKLLHDPAARARLRRLARIRNFSALEIQLLSPMGHLKFAIEVGRRRDQGPSGRLSSILLQSVKDASLLNPAYTFRNKCVAHQEKEERFAEKLHTHNLL